MNRMAISTSTLFVCVLMLLLAPGAVAGGHRDGLRTSKDPVVDCTDLYAFRSIEDPRTVVFIANFVPFALPAGGPNFYSFGDEVSYRIKIDNNGDGVADITYVWDFFTETRNPNSPLYNTGPITGLQDPDWNVRQLYKVSRVDANGETPLSKRLVVAPANIGPSSTPDYDELASLAIYTLSPDTGNGATKVFCGPRDESLYADLGALYDLLTIREFPGDDGGGVDALAGLNVLSICLQVPVVDVIGTQDAIIGVWATASRPKNLTLNAGGSEDAFGKLVQVSRMGMPFVNELLLPIALKELYNNSAPRKDANVFKSFFEDPELARLLASLHPVTVPLPPREDIRRAYMTGLPGLNRSKTFVQAEMLHLNMASQPANPEDRLGLLGGDVAGFPNGRRVGDDVVDITLRLMAGALVGGFDIEPNNQLGDGVDANDKTFLTVFPFLPSPHEGLGGP